MGLKCRLDSCLLGLIGMLVYSLSLCKKIIFCRSYRLFLHLCWLYIKRALFFRTWVGRLLTLIDKNWHILRLSLDYRLSLRLCLGHRFRLGCGNGLRLHDYSFRLHWNFRCSLNSRWYNLNGLNLNRFDWLNLDRFCYDRLSLNGLIDDRLLYLDSSLNRSILVLRLHSYDVVRRCLNRDSRLLYGNPWWWGWGWDGDLSFGGT
jgi:hypothetical protein